MAKEIQIFSNPSFGEIRTAGTSEEPLFCLTDVCRILDIKNVSDCKSRLDQKGVVLTDTPTKGGVQRIAYINEKNLSHIVNSKELSDYVARMSEIQNCSSLDLLQVTKGGDVSQQGTWAHHRVAIRVAQKLSTDFAIWVDDDEKVRKIVPTLGGNQEMWLLTEDGIYEVLMQSL